MLVNMHHFLCIPLVTNRGDFPQIQASNERYTFTSELSAKPREVAQMLRKSNTFVFGENKSIAALSFSFI